MLTNKLVEAYLKKCKKRVKILRFFFEEEDFSDVVRESQEVVELCGKALLRVMGIDPPKWHDVGPILKEQVERFPQFKEEFEKYARFSKWLRKERELAFYGEIDFIPTEEYTEEDGKMAIEAAEFSLRLLRRFVKEVGNV